MIIDANKKIENARRQNNNHVNDSEVVLSVKGVSKKFCRNLKRSLFYGVQDIASDLTGLRTKSDRLRPEEFWALDNVSFQLRRGEALGLVGKNGSGKSTLLRIIAGLIKPDLGTVEIKGRVAPLIALGAGFNPILTGRENIYANMAILGLSKKEIDERFNDVVEFAEVGEAIDSPVQTYSSGMRARLGFASAIYTEPDILLIDEVLAVGDIKFKAKCLGRLQELRRKKTTFILVSHQPQAILNVCQDAIYLLKGQLIDSGDAYSIMNRYETDLFLQDGKKESGLLLRPEKPPSESLGFDIVSLCFRDIQGNIIKIPKSGEPTIFCIGYKVHEGFLMDKIHLTILIKKLYGEGNNVLRLCNYDDGIGLEVFPGKHEIQVRLPYLGLKAGSYFMAIYAKKDSFILLDVIESFKFTVETKECMIRCLYYQPREWKSVSEDSQLN